jgi:hypothetical protein
MTCDTLKQNLCTSPFGQRNVEYEICAHDQGTPHIVRVNNIDDLQKLIYKR